ncbi:MAG: DUF1508 domain-containing protein [SAR324 cluster bacterium]|nr:DUF1508 domain-containing protein [SAR324 cluster bacterium]
MSFLDKWDLYQDSTGQWRWRRMDLDEQTVGASHAGFQTREDCVENAERHGYQK